MLVSVLTPFPCDRQRQKPLPPVALRCRVAWFQALVDQGSPTIILKRQSCHVVYLANPWPKTDLPLAVALLELVFRLVLHLL